MESGGADVTTNRAGKVQNVRRDSSVTNEGNPRNAKTLEFDTHTTNSKRTGGRGGSDMRGDQYGYIRT